MKETLIDFMRHGEPEGGSIYRGNSIDDPLTQKGWDQMWSAVAGKCLWSRIVSSPMQRCIAFARALAEMHQLPLTVDERFREVGFGDWEGRLRSDIKSNCRSEYEAFYRDPLHNRPAGAEPLEEFISRVGAGLDAILADYEGQHVLVVAHAGVVRAAMVQVLGMAPQCAYRMDVFNAGVTRFRRADSGNLLVFHNRDGV